MPPVYRVCLLYAGRPFVELSEIQYQVVGFKQISLIESDGGEYCEYC